MSASNVRKKFTTPLLRKLEKEMRRGVERQGGQVLILKDIEAFISVIEASYPDIKISKSEAKKAVDAGKKKALELSNRFKKRKPRRYNAVVAKIEKILPMNEYSWNNNIFVVSTFKRSIGAVKTAILKELQTAKVITTGQSDQVKKDIHKGHGVKGTAVSQVQIANTLMAAQQLDINGKSGVDFLRSNLDNFFKVSETPTNIQEEITALTTKYRSIVTKEGKLRADYASIVDFQSGTENIKDSVLEKKIKATFREFVSEYLTDEIVKMKGSGSLEEKIEKVVVDKLTKGIKKAKVTTKTKRIKTSSKGKVQVTGTKAKSTARVRDAGALKRAPKRKTKDTAFSQTKLYAALSTRINSVVAKNMGDPALNFQSGRFAGSVKITDVGATPQGFPSVGYTYQLYPYQTFEPGFQQGSPERDPRKLIDRSIREIAAQMLTGRLYTRRQ